MKIKLTKKFCVYVDFVEKDGEFIPGYVGKGNQVRVNDMDRNSHHEDIAKNHEWKRVIGFETDDENEAFEVEKTLIRELHTFAGKYINNLQNPKRTKYACNYTLGGEGSSGIAHSEETRQQMKISAKLANTPEVRAKKSKSHIGVGLGNKASDETKRKMSEKRTGVKYTEERRKQHCYSMKIIQNRPDIKANHQGAKCNKARAVEKCDIIEHVVIAKYEWINDAATQNNVCRSSISKCCRGITKSAGGFFWRYLI